LATLALSKEWPRYLKWGLFALMAVLTAAVLFTRAQFLFHPDDAQWRHIAPFQWLLLPHAIFGMTALLVGPLQFSSRLRAANLPLHRLLGRTYVTCVLISAPIATYMGVTFEPSPLGIEQWAQGGLWFLCTLIAFWAIRKRNIALHKVWMVRSYAMTFIFVASRLDVLPGMKMNLDQVTTLLWYLMVGAFFLPDLWNASTALLASRAIAKGKTTQ